MKLFTRWGKFSLVGLMGMVLQTGVLAALSRGMPRHYLLASGVALELTVLHNFLWHCRYTWRELDGDAPWLRRLWRFQLSNGLVSLLGNLLLMRLLVTDTHLPVLAANAVAIACCSVVNFSLADRWVFGGSKREATATANANVAKVAQRYATGLSD